MTNDKHPTPAVEVPDSQELLTMIDQLLTLTHTPDHNWDDEEYAAQKRIAARYEEIKGNGN